MTLPSIAYLRTRLSYDKETGSIARLRAAEADAKRYRWLRDKSADADGVYPMVSLTDDCGDQVSNWLFGKAVDKAVDEAMESTP